MNQYAVQDAWIKHAQAQQRDKAAQCSQRRREAAALIADRLPSLAADPFAAMAVCELWDRHGRGNITAAMVRDYLAAYHHGRHQRGYVDADELRELLEPLEGSA